MNTDTNNMYSMSLNVRYKCSPDHPVPFAISKTTDGT